MASLREFDRPADRIRLHLQARTSVPLLVEGSTDELVLKPHLRAVTFFTLNGKSNVLATLRELQAAHITGALGIIDRDFDDDEEFRDLAGVLQPYDGIDLEGMLTDLGVLETLLLHVGSSRKIALMGGPEAILEIIEQCVRPVSHLRRFNRLRNTSIPFDSVDLQSKIDRKSMLLNVRNYCSALLAAMDSPLGLTELLQIASKPESSQASGKDLMSAAGMALRHIAGNLPASASVSTILASQLRASAGLALSESAWIETLISRVEAMLTAVQEGRPDADLGSGL